MTTETKTIQKFDVNDAAERLKGKIRDAFMELLTEEQFKDMVHTELKRFTEAQRVKATYGPEVRDEPSEFSKICREVFGAHVKQTLKDLLGSPEYQTKWGYTDKGEVSDAVNQWLTENRRQLIQATILELAGGAAQQMMDTLKHRL